MTSHALRSAMIQRLLLDHCMARWLPCLSLLAYWILLPQDALLADWMELSVYTIFLLLESAGSILRKRNTMQTVPGCGFDK